jgi:hypothetical protein
MSSKTVSGCDQEILLHLDPDHELGKHIHRSGHSETEHSGNFRTIAAQRLHALFPNQAWVTREGYNGKVLELRLTVRDTIIDEFRTKIGELGFREVKKTVKPDETQKADGTDEIYDQQ